MRSTTSQLDPYSPEGCFIATAAYGTETHPKIDLLRNFRDDYMKGNILGEMFIKSYYRFSPPIADFISRHPVLRKSVRVGFVEPIHTTVKRLFYK